MKELLYISHSILPSKYANSVHVAKMCAALSRSGFSVTLLGFKGGEEFEKFYDIQDDFKTILVDFRKPKFLRILSHNLNCIWEMWRKERIIYFRYFLPLFWCLLLKRPFIVELHSPPSSKLTAFLIKKALKSEKLLAAIFITHRLKKFFEENYEYVIQKGYVLPDACDPPDIIENSLKPFDVGYVGHLYEGRGTELILEIAKELHETRFHIIGGLEEDIEKFRKRSPSNVIFYGFVSQAELLKIYSKFSIAIAPYQNKVGVGIKGIDTVNWMSPMKIFEYMANEKAIILSDLPALKEIGTDEEHFLFVNAEDAQEWINAIQRLQSNTQLLESLSKNSNRKFYKEFTWSKRAEEIKKIVESN